MNRRGQPPRQFRPRVRRKLEELVINRMDRSAQAVRLLHNPEIRDVIARLIRDQVYDRIQDQSKSPRRHHPETQPGGTALFSITSNHTPAKSPFPKTPVTRFANFLPPVTPSKQTTSISAKMAASPRCGY